MTPRVEGRPTRRREALCPPLGNLVSQTVELLGEPTEREEFAPLAARLRDGFESDFLGDDGVIRSDATTAYMLALVLGILDKRNRSFAGHRLAELVVESGYRVSIGSTGTPSILDALTRTGELDAAYRLLLQTECPSRLYPITMGATTIWQRWDSMMPAGSISPGGMISFNHYAFGAVADWMHRSIGDLAPLGAAYGRIVVAPRSGRDLTWAETSLETPHSLAAVRWDRDGDDLSVRIEVPEGAETVLRLPGRAEGTVGPGIHTR